jgi:hypothetical protein
MASSASMEQWTIVIQLVFVVFFSRYLRGESVKLTLDGRQTQLLCNLSVLNATGLLEGHALDELGQVTAAGDGGTAAESLELDLADGVVVGVDADLKLHDIAASGGADETGTDVGVVLLHATDVSGLAVVVEQCCAC